MQEQERREHQNLLPDTLALIAETELLSGRPIEIRADFSVADRGRAIFVVTDPNPKRDLVLYDPAKARFIDHLIAHECGHIREFAEASDDERRLPAIAQGLSLEALVESLPDVWPLMAAGVPPSAISAAIPAWLSGIGIQLSSIPADIEIERRLWDQHTSLRSVQQVSLKDQVRDLHQVLSPVVRDFTPRTIWVASNSMNFALVKAISEILGRPSLLDPYFEAGLQDLGEELFAMRDPHDTLEAHRRTAERWSERLGFRGLLQWRRTDELNIGLRSEFA